MAASEARRQSLIQSQLQELQLRQPSAASSGSGKKPLSRRAAAQPKSRAGSRRGRGESAEPRSRTKSWSFVGWPAVRAESSDKQTRTYERMWLHHSELERAVQEDYDVAWRVGAHANEPDAASVAQVRAELQSALDAAAADEEKAGANGDHARDAQHGPPQRSEEREGDEDAVQDEDEEFEEDEERRRARAKLRAAAAALARKRKAAGIEDDEEEEMAHASGREGDGATLNSARSADEAQSGERLQRHTIRVTRAQSAVEVPASRLAMARALASVAARADSSPQSASPRAGGAEAQGANGAASPSSPGAQRVATDAHDALGLGDVEIDLSETAAAAPASADVSIASSAIAPSPTSGAGASPPDTSERKEDAPPRSLSLPPPPPPSAAQDEGEQLRELARLLGDARPVLNSLRLARVVERGEREEVRSLPHMDELRAAQSELVRALLNSDHSQEDVAGAWRRREEARDMLLLSVQQSTSMRERWLGEASAILAPDMVFAHCLFERLPLVLLERAEAARARTAQAVCDELSVLREMLGTMAPRDAAERAVAESELDAKLDAVERRLGELDAQRAPLRELEAAVSGAVDPLPWLSSLRDMQLELATLRDKADDLRHELRPRRSTRLSLPLVERKERELAETLERACRLRRHLEAVQHEVLAQSAAAAAPETVAAVFNMHRPLYVALLALAPHLSLTEVVVSQLLVDRQLERDYELRALPSWLRSESHANHLARLRTGAARPSASSSAGSSTGPPSTPAGHAAARASGSSAPSPASSNGSNGGGSGSEGLVVISALPATQMRKWRVLPRLEGLRVVQVRALFFHVGDEAATRLQSQLLWGPGSSAEEILTRASLPRAGTFDAVLEGGASGAATAAAASGADATVNGGAETTGLGDEDTEENKDRRASAVSSALSNEGDLLAPWLPDVVYAETPLVGSVPTIRWDRWVATQQSATAASQLLAQVVETVLAMHARQVVHGAVSAANVLVDSQRMQTWLRGAEFARADCRKEDDLRALANLVRGCLSEPLAEELLRRYPQLQRGASP